jgi:hypothetical protein
LRVIERANEHRIRLSGVVITDGGWEWAGGSRATAGAEDDGSPSLVEAVTEREQTSKIDVPIGACVTLDELGGEARDGGSHVAGRVQTPGEFRDPQGGEYRLPRRPWLGQGSACLSGIEGLNYGLASFDTDPGDTPEEMNDKRRVVSTSGEFQPNNAIVRHSGAARNSVTANPSKYGGTRPTYGILRIDITKRSRCREDDDEEADVIGSGQLNG